VSKTSFIPSLRGRAAHAGGKHFANILTKLVNNWFNRRLGELLPWIWIPKAS
jgi:hypothetical protein